MGAGGGGGEAGHMSLLKQTENDKPVGPFA